MGFLPRGERGVWGNAPQGFCDILLQRGVVTVAKYDLEAIHDYMLEIIQAEGISDAQKLKMLENIAKKQQSQKENPKDSN
jgi:hypothetical protein